MLIAGIVLPMHAGAIEITILYNNVPHEPDCACSWGFACVVRTSEASILFDTGGEGAVLLQNMERLGVDPAEIDYVVLSHRHGDHTGGVPALLPRLKPLRWYIPAEFAERLRSSLQRAGHRVTAVDLPLRICPGVFSTGQLGSAIREQSLIVESGAGLIVITGCAHPGIVEITAAARAQRDKNIHLILGGFHLGGCSEREIAAIVTRLKALGVQRVAPSHCTGELAMRRFAEAWGAACIDSGCGARITIP